MISLLFLAAWQGHAQIFLTGKVLEKESGQILYPATVHNKTSDQYNMSDYGGNYRIEVHPGDEIVFSFLGYYADSIRISADATGTILHDVELTSKRSELPAVEIGALTPYQQDSLARITEFGAYLKKPVYDLADNDRSSRDVNTDFGIMLHPFTFFSKAERNKRHFHKMFAAFEQDAFIDSRYTPDLVSRLTGLSGDSLYDFMNHNRPSYTFTRTAEELEFDSWILKACKRFRMLK